MNIYGENLAVYKKNCFYFCKLSLDKEAYTYIHSKIANREISIKFPLLKGKKKFPYTPDGRYRGELYNQLVLLDHTMLRYNLEKFGGIGHTFVQEAWSRQSRWKSSQQPPLKVLLQLLDLRTSLLQAHWAISIID